MCRVSWVHYNFRANPLSDRIINALIEATQAFAEMDMLLIEYPKTKLVVTDILLSQDIYYGFSDAQPDLYQIVHSLYIPNQTNDVARTTKVITGCMAYAKSKIQEIDVLTAVDLLRMDEAIKTASLEPLLAEGYPAGLKQQIESIWSILHDLYGPRRQYVLLGLINQIIETEG